MSPAEQLRAERDEWKAKYEQAYDLLSFTRDGRDVALANQQASDAALVKARAERDEWQASVQGRRRRAGR